MLPCYAGLLKRNSFCNHLKHVAFSTNIKGNHHLQVAMFRCIIYVRIPAMGGSQNSPLFAWNFFLGNEDRTSHLKGPGPFLRNTHIVAGCQFEWVS